MAILTKNQLRDLKKRYEAQEASTKIVRGVWNELEKYVVPYRGNMFQKESNEGSVEWDKYDHYDDTAVIAAQTLSASMHGAILPRLQWFDMKFKEDELQDNNDAADWLADTAKRVYKSIENSNFSLEADEMFLDITGFGHGFMSSETGSIDEDDLHFNMIPLKEAVFEEDENGVPHRFFRLLQWTATKIVAKFGIENVPEEVAKKYENATSTDERLDLVFCIFPRSNARDVDTSKPIAPIERPFGHVYFMLKDMEVVGEEGGYYTMPVYSVPWRKVSGSQWGHGPGHTCLGDIKQLNQHRLMRTRAIEKAIDPANITTERGLMSNLDLGPRGLTVVRDMNALQPYEGKANFQISNDELVLLKTSIKQAFRTDQLELKESPAMTATEVQVRYELMQRLLGPTLGRLKVDWLDRVVENVYNIELRAGRLKEMPEALSEREFEVDIEYIGAMATAQKAQQANDIIEWAGTMGQLTQLYPDLKYLVNEDELGRTVARLKNIPEKVVNGKDEAKKAKNAEAKVIAQQQVLAQAQAEGDAAKSIGEGKQAMAAAEGTPNA